MLRARLDSQHEMPNLRFCWQGQYFQGFADVADKSKIDNIRREITPAMLRERAAHKKVDFGGSGRELASILDASARTQTILGLLFGVPGRLWGLSGRSRDVPRRSRDAFRMLFGATGHPGSLPRAILTRFRVPEASPGIDFASISASNVARYCTMLTHDAAKFCTLLCSVA